MTAWMTEAWTHSGVTETTGPEATPAIKAFFAQVGRPDVVSDEVPWCAAFVNACLDRAGISLNAVPKGERLLARSCLKIGVEIKEPQVGCIAVFKRGADPHAGHVGFVTGWTATHILLLGGNQANAVNVRAYPRSDLLGLRWPEVKTAADLASEGSRIVTTAARQTSTATKIVGDGDARCRRLGSGEGARLRQDARGLRGVRLGEVAMDRGDGRPLLGSEGRLGCRLDQGVPGRGCELGSHDEGEVGRCCRFCLASESFFSTIRWEASQRSA